MSVPANPKLYHIVHIDSLPSIIEDGNIWSDAEVRRRVKRGTIVGMRHIKDRRLETQTRSYPDLFVGSCTPFYFCPRSIMLYMIEKGNKDLEYEGGQKRIVHLVADLYKVVEWANANNRRWVFTNSNAGSRFFEDYADLRKLNQIDWEAVDARRWPDKKDGKQAEFLIETALPWFLIEGIGVYSREEYNDVHAILEKKETPTSLQIRSDWYY